MGRLNRGLGWIEDSSCWEGYACGRSLLGGGLGVGGFLRGMGTAAFCFLFGRAGKKEKQGVVSGWRVHPGLTGGGVFTKARPGAGRRRISRCMSVHHDLIHVHTIYCVIPVWLRSPGTAIWCCVSAGETFYRQTFDIEPYVHIKTSNGRRSHAARYRCAGT